MTPWVKRLLIANVGIFFLQATAGPEIASYLSYLAFVPRLALLRPWSVVTYMFLHGGFGHIFFNMLGLYMFGSRVEERIGSRRFVTLYFISGIAGAIFSLFFGGGNPIIGASAGVYGIMLAFARFWPDAQILIWFFPVEARVAVFLMTAISLWSGITGSGAGVAHFAHLGGFVGAYFYLKYLERAAGVTKFRSQAVPKVANDSLSNWKRVDPKGVHEINREEVNRILDKISAKGLSSLTAQERLFLSNFVPPDDRVPPPT